MEEREERWLDQLRQLAPSAGVALLAGLGIGWMLGWWQEGGREHPPPRIVANATADPSFAEAADLLLTLVAEEPLATAPPEQVAPTDPEPAAAASQASPDVEVIAEATPVPDLESGEPIAAVLAAAEASEPTAEPTAVAAIEAPPRPAREPIPAAAAPAPSAPARVAAPAPTAAPRSAAPAAPAPPRAPTPAAPAPRRVGVTTYVATPGDTLSGIAARFGIRVETVRQANDLGRSDVLRAGQTLKVPAADGPLHTVSPGETLSSIAASYRANTKAVAAANGLAGKLTVRSGQQLVIPGGSPPATPAWRATAPTPTPTPARNRSRS